MRILYVCTGNICRSPTAELLTTAFAAENGRSELTAHSAGTSAVVGEGVEPTAALVVKQLGGDPDGFRARALTSTIARDADLVVAMAYSHVRAIRDLDAELAPVTFTLREAALVQERSGARTIGELVAAREAEPAVGPVDIDDPVGRDEETFIRVGSEIADSLIPLLDALR